MEEKEEEEREKRLGKLWCMYVYIYISSDIMQLLKK